MTKKADFFFETLLRIDGTMGRCKASLCLTTPQIFSDTRFHFLFSYWGAGPTAVASFN